MSRAISRTRKVTRATVTGKRGIVVSQNRIASEIGATVLREGGNAVDAAVAMSFALGVVEPWMSGPGGGGYMLVQHAGRDAAEVIDFGMIAPVALAPEDYPLSGAPGRDLFPWPGVVRDANVVGARAVAIPGQVAGMGLAHELWGRKAWGDLLQPAVEEARRGVEVDWYCQMILASAAPDLAQFPASRSAFFGADGHTKASAWTAQSTQTCDLSAMAETLEALAIEGASSFYSGSIAEAILSDLWEAGGRHQARDFGDYMARRYPARRVDYRGHAVHVAPQMSAGPTLKDVLDRLAASSQPSGLEPGSETFALYAEAIHAAIVRRLAEMGDSEPVLEPGCTTHFNVIDRDGTLVSVTQTLLSMFGSRMMLPRTGLLMNNGIMWFDPEPGRPNSLGPGKRCLSNMCPIILERDDGMRAALGAAGGRKILPAVAQLVSYLLDYRMNLSEAFSTPRMDFSNSDLTIVEVDAPSALLSGLHAKSEQIRAMPRAVFPLHFGCPSAAATLDGEQSAMIEADIPWGEAVAV